MNHTNIFCIRFDFGLPLEDIFPPDDIHPRLHSLLCQARTSLLDSNLTLNQVLSTTSPGFIMERLRFKKDLIKGTLHYTKTVKPETYLWLLRHFLELLPLPLFPKYAHNHKYDWLALSMECKLCRFKSNCLLDSNIFWCIFSLPKANFLMIDTLIMFLRNLCLKRKYCRSLKKVDLTTAVQYFGPSLFSRPYSFIAGHNRTEEHLYYPLLLYLILHWPGIKQQEFQKYLTCSSEFIPQDINRVPSTSAKKEPIRLTSISEITEIDDKHSEKRVLERGCQTSSWLLLSNTAPLKEEKVTKSASEWKIDTISNINDKSKDKLESEPVIAPKFLTKISHQDYKFIRMEMVQPLNSPPQETQQGVDVENDLYEEIANTGDETKNSSFLNSNSETAICKKEQLDESFLKKKMLKVSKSLSSAVSRLNEQIKVKYESAKGSNKTLVDSCKYDLLNAGDNIKVSPLKQHNFYYYPADIKYKKLLTL